MPSDSLPIIAPVGFMPRSVCHGSRISEPSVASRRFDRVAFVLYKSKKHYKCLHLYTASKHFQYNRSATCFQIYPRWSPSPRPVFYNKRDQDTYDSISVAGITKSTSPSNKSAPESVSSDSFSGWLLLIV